MLAVQADEEAVLGFLREDKNGLADLVVANRNSPKQYVLAGPVEQIKRAAVSISNNIAEGAERVTPSEFARFLDIAKGSVGEVRSMYRLACRLKFVSCDAARSRCEACKSISRQLGGFAKHLRAASRQSREANK